MTKNHLFNLKVKELTLLKKQFKVIDNVLVITENGYEVLGCVECYMVNPVATTNGYSIPAGELINFYEKLSEVNNLPIEIAINCWMCPFCGRLFKELIPDFEIGEQ